MKKIRHLVTLLMVVVIHVMVVTTVYASDNKGTDSSVNDIEKRYISTCPYADKHLMKGKGPGEVWLNGVLQFQGTASQCNYCYLVLVTENNPFSYLTKSWGRYAAETLDDPIFVYYKMNTSIVSYNSSINDDYSQGFIFDTAWRLTPNEYYK